MDDPNFMNRPMILLDYSMYFHLTLKYAMLPRVLRKIIEFGLLLMTVISISVLVYVHISFIRMPVNCLDHVKDVWPKDGVLRVEVIRTIQRTWAQQTGTLDELFTIKNSYKRQFKRTRPVTNDVNSPTSMKPDAEINNPENKEEFDNEPSEEESVTFKHRRANEKNEISSSTARKPNHDKIKSNISTSNIAAHFQILKHLSGLMKLLSEVQSNMPITHPNLFPVKTHRVFKNYIFEYSLERAYLKMSPKARIRLGIPVMLVSLEPTRHKCFGNSVSQFFLENFVGYDNFLISSVQSLVDNEGYLVNAMTGDYIILENIQSVCLSCIISLFSMVFITSCVLIVFNCMLPQAISYTVSWLRVGWLQNLDAPLPFLSPALCLVSIFSLFGLFFVLASFFEDPLIMYIITLIIILADKYHVMFCSPITKRHWLKFFFLFLFQFYMYHYQFSSEYHYLALVCSLFCIQYSIIYFYHNYELPHVLMVARQSQINIQRLRLPQIQDFWSENQM